MNTGKKLELDFVSNLNNHCFDELNLNLKKFRLFIFKEVDNSNKIDCKKLNNRQKADISISIGDNIKYISLKTGSQNSVHVEKINSFIKFLFNEKVEQQDINNRLTYHYGNNTLTGEGKIRYSAEACKLKFKREILNFTKHINNSKILTKIIERFLLIGTSASNKHVDFIYYGDIAIGIWCSSEELLNFCINHKSMHINTPHFSVFTYQNWCRNI